LPSHIKKETYIKVYL